MNKAGYALGFMRNGANGYDAYNSDNNIGAGKGVSIAISGLSIQQAFAPIAPPNRIVKLFKWHF